MRYHPYLMNTDFVTTHLELAAVLLLAVGLAVAGGALIGGWVGVGVGGILAALVLGGASALIQWMKRPPQPRRPQR